MRLNEMGREWDEKRKVVWWCSGHQTRHFTVSYQNGGLSTAWNLYLPLWCRFYPKILIKCLYPIVSYYKLFTNIAIVTLISIPRLILDFNTYSFTCSVLCVQQFHIKNEINLCILFNLQPFDKCWIYVKVFQSGNIILLFSVMTPDLAAVSGLRL